MATDMTVILQGPEAHKYEYCTPQVELLRFKPRALCVFTTAANSPNLIAWDSDQFGENQTGLHGLQSTGPLLGGTELLFSQGGLWSACLTSPMTAHGEEKHHSYLPFISVQTPAHSNCAPASASTQLWMRRKPSKWRLSTVCSKRKWIFL